MKNRFRPSYFFLLFLSFLYSCPLYLLEIKYRLFLMKLFWIVVIFLLRVPIIQSQTIGEYRTINHGGWSDLSIWQIYDGVSWTSATAKPSYQNGFIGVYHNVWSSGDTIDQVVVHTTGRLSYMSVGYVVNDGIGVDLLVNGILNGAHIENLGQIEVNGRLKLTPGGVFRGSGSTIVNGITDVEGTIVNSGPFVNTSLVLNDTLNFSAKELKSHPNFNMGSITVNGYFNWANGGNINNLNLTLQNGITKLGPGDGSITGLGLFVFNGNFINVNDGKLSIEKSLGSYNGSILVSSGKTLTLASTGNFGGNIVIETNATLRLQNGNKTFLSSSNISGNGRLWHFHTDTISISGGISLDFLEIQGNALPLAYFDIKNTAVANINRIEVKNAILNIDLPTSLTLNDLKIGPSSVSSNFTSRLQGYAQIVINNLLETRNQSSYSGAGGIISNGNIILDGFQNNGSITFNNLGNSMITGSMTNSLNANLTFNSNINISGLVFSGSNGNFTVNGTLRFTGNNSTFQTKNLSISDNMIINVDNLKTVTFGGVEGNLVLDSMLIFNGKLKLEKNLNLDNLKIDSLGTLDISCTKNLTFTGSELINNGKIIGCGTNASYLIFNNNANQSLIGMGETARLLVNKQNGQFTLNSNQSVSFQKFDNGIIIIE